MLLDTSYSSHILIPRLRIIENKLVIILHCHMDKNFIIWYTNFTCLPKANNNSSEFNYNIFSSLFIWYFCKVSWYLFKKNIFSTYSMKILEPSVLTKITHYQLNNVVNIQ